MCDNYFTFLIFPGTHGNLRKIHVHYYVVQLIVCFAFAGVATVGTLAHRYGRMLLKVSTYNTLRAECEALKAHCLNLESTVTRTNGKLESLESLAADVALTFSISEGPSPRFPADVVHAATRRHAALGEDYDASVYAFKMMRATPLPASYTPTAFSSVIKNAYQDSATPSIWPVQGSIAAGFGQRMDPFSGEGAFHNGLDIATSAGTPVKATADGILFVAGPDAGYGNEALIDHGYGVATKYAHLSTLCVFVGQQVRRGQVIGTVGMTGRATGPHLHYEVLVQGTPVNPTKFLPG